MELTAMNLFLRSYCQRADEAFIKRSIISILATFESDSASVSRLSYQTYSVFGVSLTARTVVRQV